MAERRNKRYVKVKEIEKPMILAKRENTSVKIDKNKIISTKYQERVQPKILLKPKDNKNFQQQAELRQSVSAPSVSNGTQLTSQNPSNSTQIKEREILHFQTTINEQPAPIMTHPTILISSHNYQVNLNATKVLMKTNTDFFVVGVLGTQSVGKSTIMNLLAAESCDKFKEQIFSNKDGVFLTSSRFRTNINEADSIAKNYSSLPTTEPVHMFITKDRTLLLDCPPVLCNTYRRDATTNEVDDMKLIILLLTTCHLLIVVQNDYINLNLMRLLQFAELMKPSNNTKSFFNDPYFPNILFVKNKTKLYDFANNEKHRMEKMIRSFFTSSQLQTFIQTKSKMDNQNNQLKNNTENKQKMKIRSESEKNINYFVLPEIKDYYIKPNFSNLETVFREFRNCVFTSPRSQIYAGNVELTESSWFDLVTTTMLNKSNFFLTSYEETRRSHRDLKLEEEIGF